MVILDVVLMPPQRSKVTKLWLGIIIIILVCHHQDRVMRI